MIDTLSIPEQLTEIYLRQENWHTFKMPYDLALKYHTKRYNNGEIQVYEENGEILGYYERHFVYNVCFLDNVWIRKDCRQDRVFKILHKRFFDTMPNNITYIMGEKYKLGGKFRKVSLKRRK